MKARIAVIAGDGIGPEVIARRRCACSRPVARALRPRSSSCAKPLSAASPSTTTATRCRQPRSTRAWRRMRSCSAPSAARSGRRRTPGCARSRACCGCARELGVYANLRPVERAPGAARRLDAQARSARRRGPGVRARAHRRHLLRREDARRHDAPATCAATRCRRSSASRALPAGSRRQRRRKLTSIDKANVLETSRLWREVVDARDAERNFPTCSSSTCWWIRRPCT